MTWQEKILEKMKNIKCLKRERGSILVLTALLLPVLFGCLGIAYDVGNIYIHKSRLQNVTDAAALAGGRAYLLSQKKTTGTKDTYDNYTNGNITDEEYVIGGSKTRGGLHPDADNAADVYIYNNIINLGNTVYSDKFSHYALPGYKKVGEDYVNADEIFYRIGLYEKVPLYFLSVITNKNVETVRAGSVVVIGQGTESGLKLNPDATFSIFDNLFTYSGYLDITNSSKYNEGWIKTAFIGDMVYTHRDDINKDMYYLTDPNLERHYYSTTGSFGGQSIEDKPINDPVINTNFDITSYVPAFVKKLESPHVDVKPDDVVKEGDDKNIFKASRINWYYKNHYDNNSLNNVYHLGSNDKNYSRSCAQLPDGNFIIDFDAELDGDPNIPIFIILDETTSNYKLKGTKSTNRPVVIACLSENVNMSIDDDYKVPTFKGIIYQPYAGSVPLHFKQEGQKFIGNIIARNIQIHGDGKSGPYVIFEKKNWVENTGVYVDPEISNITRKIQGDNSDISSKLTPELREKIETIYKDIKLKKIIWWPYQEIYEDVDVAGNIGNMDWFNNLPYEAKKLMYQRWRDYYNSHSEDPTRDLLWMWNGYFEDGGEEGGNENKSETLRLINYRTEYQPKENMEDGYVLDPYIYETLGKPNSY